MIALVSRGTLCHSRACLSVGWHVGKGPWRIMAWASGMNQGDRVDVLVPWSSWPRYDDKNYIHSLFVNPGVHFDVFISPWGHCSLGLEPWEKSEYVVGWKIKKIQGCLDQKNLGRACCSRCLGSLGHHLLNCKYLGDGFVEAMWVFAHWRDFLQEENLVPWQLI